MREIERRQAEDRTQIAQAILTADMQHRSTRRLFVGGLGLTTVATVLGVVAPAARKILEPIPTLPPAPTPEATPIPEPMDITPNDGKFRIRSEISLDRYQRDDINDVGMTLADFDLPAEILVKKDWRDVDGGYTRVTPHHIDLSSDLFRYDTSLEKQKIEIQHAMAKILIVNIDPLNSRYKNALGPLGELLSLDDDYTSMIKATQDKELKRGFLIFNPYRFVMGKEQNEEDISRHDVCMETNVADYFANVVTTTLLSGTNMAKTISDFPIQQYTDPGMMATYDGGPIYIDSPERSWAKNGFNKSILLLKSLANPDVKPGNDTKSLLRRFDELSGTINADIQHHA